MTPVEEGKISSAQMLGLLVVARLTPLTIGVPFLTGVEVPQDAWIGALVGAALSIPPLLLVAHLGSKYPGQTIIEYSQKLLGAYPGKALGLVLVWYWLGGAAVTARSTGEAYAVGVLSRTPLIVVTGAMVLISAQSARCGLEVTARIGQTVAIAVLGILLLITPLPYSTMHPENLLPVLPKGFGTVIDSAATNLAFYMQLIISGMLIPYTSRPKEAGRVICFAVLITSLLAVILTTSVVLVFGPTAPTLVLPTLSLARQISIGQFLERVEVISLTAWTVTSALKTSLFLWASATGLAQIFGLKRFQPLVYPLASLVLTFSIVFFQSLLEVHLYFKSIWTVYSPVVASGSILILVAAHAISSRSGPFAGKARGPGK